MMTLLEIKEELLRIVNEQAEDEGLWAPTEDSAAAYIQEGLRALHRAIETVFEEN